MWVIFRFKNGNKSDNSMGDLTSIYISAIVFYGGHQSDDSRPIITWVSLPFLLSPELIYEF